PVLVVIAVVCVVVVSIVVPATSLMDHLASGSPVKIFRTKCDSWIPGRISDTKTESDWVTVEFTEDDLLCRKKLHVASLSLQRMDSSTLPGRRQSRHEEEEC
ncbi:unnamed protein product, partial [Polarella glacialis]